MENPAAASQIRSGNLLRLIASGTLLLSGYIRVPPACMVDAARRVCLQPSRIIPSRAYMRMSLRRLAAVDYALWNRHFVPVTLLHLIWYSRFMNRRVCDKRFGLFWRTIFTDFFEISYNTTIILIYKYLKQQYLLGAAKKKKKMKIARSPVQ